MKPKRKLTKISFDFDNPHLAYTSADQPACSLVDDPVLLKSLEQGKELTINQIAILTEAGHDVSEVSKSLQATENTTSTTPVAEEENLNKNQEGTTLMTDQVLELKTQIEELQKQLKKADIEKSLGKYSLETEVQGELAEALVSIADTGAVFKAMDAIVIAADTKMEELKKSIPAEENPLAKSLQEEQGEGGDPEEEKLNKSLSERLAAFAPTES